MSSNPFRRSKLLDGPPPPPPQSSTVSFGVGPSDGASSNPPKRTKKKRVQIQTPPHSPELTHSSEHHEGRRLSAADSAGRAESPPPPASAFTENESELDSTATADSELEEAVRNTKRNSGSLPPETALSTSGMKAPYNPFARTLATEQAESGLHRGSIADEETSNRSDRGRPALDVESFKNILLTGRVTPSPPTGTPAMAASTPRPHGSSSSTETSSVFDSAYSVPPESPRPSFDDYEDASSSDDEHSDEHSNLMGQGRLDDLAPQAPPKSKSRGPQTISFADFDQSIPRDFQRPQRGTSPVNPYITGILRPSMPRSSSDLNKPLPAPPKYTSDHLPHMGVTDKDLALSPQITPTAPILDDQSIPKKIVPPPPPPTRRKGGELGRPRSVSDLSNTTRDSLPSPGTMTVEGRKVLAKPEDSYSRIAPPPPPSRKSQPISHPSSEVYSKDASPNHFSNDVPKFVPAPPPRRQPSKAVKGENSARSSIEASRPIRPGDAFLAAVTPNNAPPAPPPRRGGSKRSSLDEQRDTVHWRLGGNEKHRRSSGNSFDSQGSDSMLSLENVPEPGEESNAQAIMSPSVDPKGDILADLSAFQAEIDALRARSEGAR